MPLSSSSMPRIGYPFILGADPRELRVAWVPERVRSTGKLAPLFRDPELANGGYQAVLLDDRLLVAWGSPRATFDDASRSRDNGTGQAPLTGPCRIDRSRGLWIVPMSIVLRYLVPPSRPDDFDRLGQFLDSAGPGQLLTYADDLEKVAAVGPWSHKGPRRYESFLSWLTGHADVTVVRLSDWLKAYPPEEHYRLDAGTYYELARAWNAGEDYRGWWDDPAFASHRQYFRAALADVGRASEDGSDSRLVELAWKHLLASDHETAWHDAGPAGRRPAPWALATASHARSAHVFIAAARWLASDPRRPEVRVIDLDRDAEDKVVLSNERVYAVVSPRWGGRVIHLFAAGPEGGVAIVRNAADDWNWQETLNRSMDVPPNHPGAFAVIGFQHDAHIITQIGQTARKAWVELTDVEPGSTRQGCRRTYLLAEDVPGLVFCGQVDHTVREIGLETCLSLDYYRLLREGPAAVRPVLGASARGVRNGEVSAWLALRPEERTTWSTPDRPSAGHGFNFTVIAQADHFHLLLGTGQLAETALPAIFEHAITLLHGPQDRERTRAAARETRPQLIGPSRTG